MVEENSVFSVYQENSIVFVFKFTALNTVASVAWRDYSLKYNGHYPEPLRVLYDFSECKGLPSPYLISTMRELMPKLILPKNSRYAYLVPNREFHVWANAFFGRSVERGQAQSFFQRDEAIEWLMQGLEDAN